jgi:hypothetical protein
MLSDPREREQVIDKVIEACRMLILKLANPETKPLEREAGYVLAKALYWQVENLCLTEDTRLQEFMQLYNTPRPLNVRRYPQDFDTIEAQIQL